MGVTTDYLERTQISILNQMRVRGIVPEAEADGVYAVIAKKFGKKPEAMNDSELKRLNRSLPDVFIEYLEGAKRR